jgi:hypothetical protein
MANFDLRISTIAFSHSLGRNNPLSALSIRFEGFNARPVCDTKVLIVVTVRRFHTASTLSRRPANLGHISCFSV